jgi:hypothetical protein
MDSVTDLPCTAVNSEVACVRVLFEMNVAVSAVEIIRLAITDGCLVALATTKAIRDSIENATDTPAKSALKKQCKEVHTVMKADAMVALPKRTLSLLLHYPLPTPISIE